MGFSKICATIVATNIKSNVEKTTKTPTLSGPVQKKSASSDKPRQAQARPKKRFGLLQMVQKVRHSRDEKPKITNPWDLTEIPYNVRNKNQIRRLKLSIQTNLLPGKTQLWTGS